MSCLEHDEHYIVTFPNGYGRLVCLTADLCNGSTDYCSVMVRRCVEGRERETRGGVGGGHREWDGGRGRQKRRIKREDLRVFIANFFIYMYIFRGHTEN